MRNVHTEKETIATGTVPNRRLYKNMISKVLNWIQILAPQKPIKYFLSH
jgi:hypothetical protein